ncbi:hypothetical protein K461DRAFT_283172 [Myriangium duriaei CBS 260.36]|uniref:Uncharacterized protein n=1 Tax=Myriangium duriaei CBS 260.36 TaxID=1168546 RepID=A0A9P4IWM7_9PEZI|nr:hypothetical protein K461DRAFT_283172 [Myriangium duriaei CBS 260.36]
MATHSSSFRPSIATCKHFDPLANDCDILVDAKSGSRLLPEPPHLAPGINPVSANHTTAGQT